MQVLNHPIQKYAECIGIVHPLNKQIKGLQSYILPLKSITHNVFIINALANVQTQQIFFNNTQHFLEVQYRFPVNPKACFYRFEGTFGIKKIEGVVKEKQQARQQYSESVKQGKKAGYGQVSKQSKDIMKVQFGNISPKQELKVQIRYVEELSLTLNTFYKFDLCTKLNPRYANSVSVPNYIGNVDNKTQAVKGQFAHVLNLRVTAQRKINSTRCLTHQLINQGENSQNNQLKFTVKSGSLANRDFSFMYSTEDFHLPSYTVGKSNDVTTAMISFIPKYCTLSLQDSKKAALNNQILEVDIDTVKGEYIFLLDRSGSMGGSRIEKAKNALILFIKSLPIDSYFNVVSFGSNFQPLFKKSERNQLSSVNHALQEISKMTADMGGTEIQRPLRQLLSQKVIEGYPKQLFLLTDGEVDNTTKVVNLVRKNIKYARVHAIGIGNGASRALIQGCAQKGKGHCTFIQDSEDCTEKIIQLLNDSLTPVISHVSLTCDNSIVQNIVPNPASIPYILKNEIAHFYLTFKSELKVKTRIIFSYTDSVNGQQFKTQMDIYPNGLSESFVAKMGQFTSLLALEDAEAEGKKLQQYMYFVKDVNLKQQIVKLSIKHQILSKYSSFLFVEKQLQDGEYQEVKDKGQLALQIGEGKAEGVSYVDQPDPAYDYSDSEDQYHDECATNSVFVDECCLGPSESQIAEYDQKAGEKQLKQAGKQGQLRIVEVVKEQLIEGCWKNVEIVRMLFNDYIYRLVMKFQQKEVAATYLITRWIEKNQQGVAMSLIIKKAKSWLKKQPSYKIAQTNFAGYFK